MAYNNFSTIIFNLYELYFPLVRKKFNVNFHSLEKWMTTGIFTSRREKICLCNISISQPSLTNKDTFKRYRNAYNKIIRVAKKMYFENELLKYQSNLKKTWQVINLAINKKPNKSAFIDSLIVNGIVTSDPLFMANSFN